MTPFVRGTQLRDNVKILYDYGAKEIHMRIACPPLIYGCPFIAFTSSKSDMELITRRIIEEIEGDGNAKLDRYATTGSPEYNELVERIRARFGPHIVEIQYAGDADKRHRLAQVQGLHALLRRFESLLISLFSPIGNG